MKARRKKTEIKPKGSKELIDALDAISRLPDSKLSLKDSLASADNIQERVALATLDCVERLCLSGINGHHAVRYLRSVLSSRKDGILPHALNPYTRSMLEEIDGHGEPTGNHSCRSPSSVPKHPATQWKKTAR